jgi:hypothetical protein
VTLVVGFAAGSGVLHVGDRFLTQAGDPWDPYANKSVVVLGRDGWATVSYSGLAHIGGRLTDEWLAEVFSEWKPEPGFHGGVSTLIDSSLMPTLGPALRRLPEAIERDFGREPVQDSRRHGIGLLVCGFIMRRRRSPRVRPFMTQYRHSGRAGAALDTETLPRIWRWSHEVWLDSVGVASGRQWDQLQAALERPGRENADSVEHLLIDHIRAEAARPGSIVGPNCMSIALSSQGHVRVRFLPAPADAASAISFTPWIVAPGMVVPPLVLSGGLPQIHAGPYVVVFERQPPLPPSTISRMYGQPRKPLK